MKVLVACEESQAVCIAFRERGHEAYSCDMQECSGGHPEWHIHADISQILMNGFFNTQNGDLHEVWRWDIMIAFPPCTFLANAGLHYLQSRPERRVDHKKAFDFVKELYNSKIEKVAIENPVGWLNTNWKKPDQIIQPYYFGDPEIKTTCLFLKNLPKLVYNDSDNLFEEKTMIDRPLPRGGVVRKSGPKKGQMYNYYFRQGKNAKNRAKTFPGIAKAMAEQWG